MKSKIIALILILMLGMSTIAFSSSGFKDVKPGSWYYEYIMKISNMGVISGYNDNTFKPNDNVTRAQLAKILIEYDKQNNSISNEEKTIINSIENVINSTVKITSNDSFGSGFFVKENIIMTNSHVIGSDNTVSITTYSGDKISGNVITRDKGLDIALIKVDYKAKPLVFSNSLKVGQNAIAIGNPMGMDNTVSKGIVSKIGIHEFKDSYMLQMDTAINSGNSGGVVINSSGEIIGMATGKFTDIDIMVEGISFAIQSSELQNFLNKHIK